MPARSSIRLMVVASALALLMISGLQVPLASTLRATRSVAEPRGPAAGGGLAQDAIPHGYQREQEGSGVVFHVVSSSRETPLERVSVKNSTSQAVVGVRVVAAVERWGASSLQTERLPVRLFVSDLTPIAIAPGQTVEVAPDVLSASQVDQVAAESPGARLQLHFGLAEVRYVNGFGWSIELNAAAMTGPDALGVSRPWLPRELLSRDADRGAAPVSHCRDSLGRSYSDGAVVPVLNEPGVFGHCEGGRWIEAAGR